MRLELVVPFAFGTLLAAMGLLLLFDAWTPDHLSVLRDRRRRPRSGRSRTGEAAVGLGVLCMAAAMYGRDSWRYSIVTAIAGTVLLLYGAVLSHKYVGESLARQNSRGVSEGGESTAASEAGQGSEPAAVGAEETAGQQHEREQRLRIR